MRSRDCNPVAAGFTSWPLTLRFARACALTFTRRVFDINLVFCSKLVALFVVEAAGDVARSVIASTYAVDRRSKENTDVNAIRLRDLFFIVSSNKFGWMFPVSRRNATNNIFRRFGL